MPANFSRRFRMSTASALATIMALTTVAPADFPRFVAAAHAQGQPQEQIDFEAALEGYGHWVEHPRLGDVWVPDNVPQDWQPYRIGHWVYSDEWGWYWNSDEDFGWVTYHYGRWYLDRELGWAWVPGDEWGPAWVNWRQGDDFVGWAPTPPDEFIDVEEVPDSYMFVRAGDLLAPEVYTVFVPYRERRDFYYRSTLINRTIIFADRRGAVNPGIPPAFIASASGRPFHYSHVAPVVLAGTVGVVGAVILQNNFRDRSRTRVVVRETDRIIRPGERFQRLPGLNKGERARFWNNNEFRSAQSARPVLNYSDQSVQQRRYIRTKGDATKFEQQQKKIEERRIESKQIQQQKDLQQKNIEQRNLQQRNLQQQTAPQQNLQQKSEERRRWNEGDRKRSEDNKRDFERKDTQQKNIEQKNIQQRNLQQQTAPQQNLQQKSEERRRWNEGDRKRSEDNRRNLERRDTQQRNIEQRNLQQNTQRQQMQEQHSAPKPQTTQRPQQNNKPGDKDK
jgi:hypothetical protein